MKWKKYDYTAQWGPGNTIVHRPLIEVRISSATNSKGIPILAMIDSGTDGTVFNADIARALRIDPNRHRKVRIGGIGEQEGFTCAIRLTVPDFKLYMDIPVVFLENPPFDGLLGQRHFFEKFQIKFDKAKKIFHIAANR